MSSSIYRPAKGSKLPSHQASPYLVSGLMVNLLIWASSLTYLNLKVPTFISAWAINVPTNNSATKVSLPEIGQASADSASPYSISGQDPRQNYKFIAQSEPVIRAAASLLNMTPEKFGTPVINTSYATTTLEFYLKGESPEAARKKSHALFQAMQARVDELREQEFAQKDGKFHSVLFRAQRKLEVTQKRLSDYKLQSGLSSKERIKELTGTIETLRKQKAELVASWQQADARLIQLRENLDIPEKEISDILKLKSDRIFQDLLARYHVSYLNLIELNSKFLPNHPTILVEQDEYNELNKAIFNRVRVLLGKTLSKMTIQRTILHSNSVSISKENLFQAVVEIGAERQGLQAQAEEMQQQLSQLEARLRDLSQKGVTLDALERDLQVAEAVFSSILINLDLVKTNVFGSYPLIQLLVEPSLPQTPSSPNKFYLFFGSALGSLFTSAGIFTFWLRQERLSKKVVSKHLGN
ncbi:hypothetical protein B7486_44490 [cyanobacterium TDX16]|nr:hypothetical protein B7486_44490 [cyanobacterium TDX16]